jgi:hypothetical protein
MCLPDCFSLSHARAARARVTSGEVLALAYALPLDDGTGWQRPHLQVWIDEVELARMGQPSRLAKESQITAARSPLALTSSRLPSARHTLFALSHTRIRRLTVIASHRAARSCLRGIKERTDCETGSDLSASKTGKQST